MSRPFYAALTVSLPRTRSTRRTRLVARDWVALSAVTVAGLLTRLWHLSLPHDLIFDETYYAKDGCWYYFSSQHLCGVAGEQTTVHPPLGKWLIGAGTELFGYDSFGWRLAPLVAGVASVALLYLVAHKLLGSTWAAAGAAGLLVIDPLHFVQSRVAMLDVFVPAFALAAFLFLLLDRDRMAARSEGQGKGRRLRGWRLAAGVAAGAATACKWSGALVLVAVIFLTIAWEIAARREDGEGRVLTRLLREETASIVMWLVVAPVVVYALTYIGRLDGGWTVAPWAEGSWLHDFAGRQAYMFVEQRDLSATHSYESPAWSWLLLKRAVSYYFKTTPSGDYREVLVTGSPFVWWSSILALIYVGVRWVRSMSWRAPMGTILAGFAFTYLPWLVLARGRDAVFIFYLLPSIPFMCLALAWAGQRLGHSWEARTAVSLFAAGAVAMFVFYWPLLTAGPIAPSAWHQRLWVFDSSQQCAKPPGVEKTTTVTETKNGTPSSHESVTNTNSSLPPTGWCWV